MVSTCFFHPICSIQWYMWVLLRNPTKMIMISSWCLVIMICSDVSTVSWMLYYLMKFFKFNRWQVVSNPLAFRSSARQPLAGQGLVHVGNLDYDSSVISSGRDVGYWWASRTRWDLLTSGIFAFYLRLEGSFWEETQLAWGFTVQNPSRFTSKTSRHLSFLFQRF